MRKIATQVDKELPDRSSATTPKLSPCVVVPAFNEARSITSVVNEVRRALPSAFVVVVDDGSTDETARLAAKAGATVVSLPVNLGIGGAVQAGYRYALKHHFEVVLQVDGDGQHDPSYAERLLEVVADGSADVAIGSRWLGHGDNAAPTGRRLGMRVLATIVRWRTGQRFTDTTSGFRAIGPRAVELFARSYPTDFPEVESIVFAVRKGLRVLEVPVHMNERRHGRSSIAGARSAYYMARVVVALFVDSLNRKDRA
jgi:glycosyltransferase involved in cell wall biosynthesis